MSEKNYLQHFGFISASIFSYQVCSPVLWSSLGKRAFHTVLPVCPTAGNELPSSHLAQPLEDVGEFPHVPVIGELYRRRQKFARHLRFRHAIETESCSTTRVALPRGASVMCPRPGLTPLMRCGTKIHTYQESIALVAQHPMTSRPSTAR